MFKKNRNYDNDKLQCFTKTFNFSKYKKCSHAKYALMLYAAVSIRWISIKTWNFEENFSRFDVYLKLTNRHPI